MVSFSVSPFEVLVDEASLKPITRPPRRFTAVSKLSLVRVEGSFGWDSAQNAWPVRADAGSPLSTGR